VDELDRQEHCHSKNRHWDRRHFHGGDNTNNLINMFQHPENRKRGIVSFIVSQKYSAEQGDYDDRCLTSHPSGRMRATGGQG
jgi:hypothetical protein